MVRIGDYVTFKWGFGAEFTGIVLQVDENPDMSFLSRSTGIPTAEHITYSFLLLESDGRSNWYDVWGDQDSDVIIHNRST